HSTPVLAERSRPARILRGSGADARALREILVPPDVDDLVERPDLRVQESRERGVLLAALVRLAVPLLDLSQATGHDTVGADLVDHALSFQTPNCSRPPMRRPAYERAGRASTGMQIVFLAERR